MTQWTQNQIRQAMRAVGHYCTMTEWAAHGFKPSITLITATYGSWGAAWKEAGLTPPDRRSQILAQLRQVGRYCTAAEWDRTGHVPHSRTIRRYWPRWQAAWEAAGVITPAAIDWPQHPRWHRLAPTDQGLWLDRHQGQSLAQLAAVYSLSREGVRYRLQVIQRELEGQNLVRPRVYTLNTIVGMLQRWHQHTGYWPTRRAWTAAHQQPTAATIVRYTGSWRAALELAALRGAPQQPSRTRRMTIAEASRQWHFSPRTIQRLIHSGIIPAEQLGRQWIIYGDPKLSAPFPVS